MVLLSISVTTKRYFTYLCCDKRYFYVPLSRRKGSFKYSCLDGVVSTPAPKTTAGTTSYLQTGCTSILRPGLPPLLRASSAAVHHHHHDSNDREYALGNIHYSSTLIPMCPPRIARPPLANHAGAGQTQQQPQQELLQLGPSTTDPFAVGGGGGGGGAGGGLLALPPSQSSGGGNNPFQQPQGSGGFSNNYAAQPAQQQQNQQQLHHQHQQQQVLANAANPFSNQLAPAPAGYVPPSAGGGVGGGGGGGAGGGGGWDPFTNTGAAPVGGGGGGGQVSVEG